MKPEQPNQQKQERAQQIEELLERLNPFSGRTLLGLFTLAVLVLCVLFAMQIKGVKTGAEPYLGTLIALAIAVLWVARWLTSPKRKEWLKQCSVEELASLFGDVRKIVGHMFALSAVGLVCWIGSTLIGMFDFSIPRLGGFCAAITVAGLMYLHYRRTEQQARRLAEQGDET